MLRGVGTGGDRRTESSLLSVEIEIFCASDFCKSVHRIGYRVSFRRIGWGTKNYGSKGSRIWHLQSFVEPLENY